jgi:hypothetical protein
MPGKTKTYLSAIGAIMGWAAVLTEYYLIFGYFETSATEVTIRFFSFFTIWTNILLSVYFTANLLKEESRIRKFFQQPGILTAIAAYITLVGSVYQIVLRAIWTPHGLQIVADEFLHTIIPVFVVVFWVMYEKKQELKWRQLPRWLIFPLIYLFVAMIRGMLSGWYPYPFLDLTKLDIAHLILNITLLLGYFFFLAALFVGIGKLITKKKALPTGE